MHKARRGTDSDFENVGSVNVGLRENNINSSVQPSKLFDIATLNVCGLRKRSNFPEFFEFMLRFDLLCFNETKIDEIDVISFPGYDSIHQPRKQPFLRKSGGISIYFKDEFSRFYTPSDYVSWISIDKALLHLDENLILGSIYIPPESSNFYNDEELMTLENEITSFCSDYKYIILTGDFNVGWKMGQPILPPPPPKKKKKNRRKNKGLWSYGCRSGWLNILIY